MNGPEWGDSDIVESDSMEVSQASEKMRRKRESNFVEVSTRKVRSSAGFREGIEDRNQDGWKFNIILRFDEERGIPPMNPVKLTTILRNQIGDIHLAKKNRRTESRPAR